MNPDRDMGQQEQTSQSRVDLDTQNRLLTQPQTPAPTM